MECYAGVVLKEGRLSVSYNNNGIKTKVLEYEIAEITSWTDIGLFDEVLKDIKEKLNVTVTNICICVPPEIENYQVIIFKIGKAGFKRFQVVKERKAESLEAIINSGYNLKHDKNIWVNVYKYRCVWHGRKCIESPENEPFEYSLITTKFPPDIFIYDNNTITDSEQSFVSELFPDCKTVKYKFKQRNTTNFALIYAQHMEIMFPLDGSTAVSCNESFFKLKRNEHLPTTNIHFGVEYSEHFFTEFFAVYNFKGLQKEFSFEVEELSTSKEKWNYVQEMFKIVEANLNGIFGNICFVDDDQDSKKFLIKWSKQIGFKNVQFINEMERQCYKAILQMPQKIQPNDIIWINATHFASPAHKYYKFQNNGYQMDFWFNENENGIEPTMKGIPNFILLPNVYSSKKHGDLESRKNNLKKIYPMCQFFIFENETPSNTAFKYAQRMGEESFPNTIFSESKTVPPNDFQQIQQLAIMEVKEPITKVTNKSSRLEKSVFKDNLIRTSYIFPQKISFENSQIKVIGIDLGTSRCCAAVNRKNCITTVHLDNNGERLLPSYVAYDEEMVKCGKVVVNRLRHFAKWTVFDSKRIIGRSINDIEIDSNWPFEISQNDKKILLETKKCNIGIQISAQEVAADLLKYIKQKSEDFQGTKLTDVVVITVPAAFTDAQKAATLEAAKLAGWESVTLLPEPIAAAFAYFIDQPIPNNSTVLVFDLGGGTLDVCIFKIENNQIQILSNTGDTKLGGRDFDTVLFNHFKNQLATKYGITLIRDKKYKLILDCQRVKEDISTVTSSFLNVDEYEPNASEIITITREEFQAMTKPLLNRIKNTLLSALYDSKLKENEINKILLVGGGSRMPMIKQILHDTFPSAEHCCEEHPDEVVAMGAAYYAYSTLS